MTYSLENRTRGSANKNAKVNEAQVIMMRRLHAEEGWGYKRLAKHFNLSPSNVRNIIARQRWKHI